MNSVRRLVLSGAVLAVPVLGITAPAWATTSDTMSDTASSPGLPPGTKICAGAIGPSAPGDFTITGSAGGAVRWTIWADNDPVLDDPYDPSPATKIFKVNDRWVNQTVLSNASHHWGCAFNEYSSTQTVNATVTISE